MQDADRRGLSGVMTALIVLAILAAAYVGSYFVVMDREIPAEEWDWTVRERRRRFRSSFRWVPWSETVSGEAGILFRKSYWVNYLYLPLDLVFAEDRTPAP